MEEAFLDKSDPNRWIWTIINNLDKFDNSPEYIMELIEKIRTIKDHEFISSFENIFKVVETYFNEHNKFPDTSWLKLHFMDVRTIYEYPNPFSMQIYESFMHYLEQEIMRQTVIDKIANPSTISVENARDVIPLISKYADHSVNMEESTKEEIIGSYDKYSENFDGVKTWIKPIDDVIGVLGYQSLSVFAAPSGHGKSTFAFSVAYYAALHGACVDYLSFEVPFSHAWFNLISAYSEGKDHALPASKLKCNELTGDEPTYFKIYARELLGAIKENNGFLNIIDQTMSAGADTYEGLCTMLETRAEKRKRKADLIIVDNFDNFQTLRSKEKDELARLNNYVIKLDGFSKKYCNGAGTAILLLSQVNRDGMKRLYASAKDETKKNNRVDVTCIQRVNGLYEKATCVLLGFADEGARSSSLMRVQPVKLRNKPVPETPIILTVKYGFSKVRGESVTNKFNNRDEYNKVSDDLFNKTKEVDYTTNDIPDEKPPKVDYSEEEEMLLNGLADEIE